jgi:hypothetical protein
MPYHGPYHDTGCGCPAQRIIERISQSLRYTRAEWCGQVSKCRPALSSAPSAEPYYTLVIAVSHVVDSHGLIISPLIITVIRIALMKMSLLGRLRPGYSQDVAKPDHQSRPVSHLQLQGGFRHECQGRKGEKGRSSAPQTALYRANRYPI